MGIAKKCCVTLPLAFLAAVALLLTCLANFWCQSYSYESRREGVNNFQAGLWYYTGASQGRSQIFGDNMKNDNKSNTDDTLFVNSHGCAAYPQGTPMDPFWHAARAFSIIATILGFIFFLILCLVPLCFVLRSYSWRTTGLSMMIFMPLFQGLTFLFWRSDQCKDRAQLDDYDNDGQSFLETYPGRCKWDQGSSINCAAIVLWFLTGLFMTLIPSPTHHKKEHVTNTEVHEKHNVMTPGHTTAATATGAGAGAYGAHTAEHRSDMDNNNTHGIHHHHNTTPGYTPTTTTATHAPTPTTTAPAMSTVPASGTGGVGHHATNPAVHPTTSNEPGTLHNASHY